ncbi:MAG: DNA polymerase III subunit alpha [Bacteroidetes bacterium]|nr:DNA polymerase III subunit alpha [Bacteroidota bacterium]
MYLNCHSYYSLRYGTLSVEKLVDEAVRCGAKALALTDINNSTGIMEFIQVCTDKGVKPIAGIEFRRDDELLYVGLARNNEGFRELNDYLSRHNLSNQPLPDRPEQMENVYWVFPLRADVRYEMSDGGYQKSAIRHLTSAVPSPHHFIGLSPASANRLMLSRHRHLMDRMVIWQPVTLLDEKGYELHRNFRAVDKNVLLSRLDPGQLASPDEIMKPLDNLLEPYLEFPGIIRNTEKLIEDCSISFDFRECKNKRTFTGNVYDDHVLLEKLALDGLQYRYRKGNVEALNRIRHELGIISKMGFSAYFLIAWDIIRYSISRGFFHVGRGSGANSIVAYCLKITDVDPIDLDLYFERFINPKRTSPPDFDIDYSWKERDEVLDYIFKRYGHEHTALLGAMSTFRDRSIIRELGKVHGLPKQEMDLFIKHPEDAIHNNHIIKKINELGEMMADFPNMRTIHAGGVLISEHPITCYTSLDMPPKGFPTTQFDMYVAEDIGFEKLDILSQRGIGHIYETAGIVRKNKGVSVDVHKINEFKADEEVKKLLRTGKTIGCFYVESPAMRGLLKKLHCDNYRSLVAASSIIRPGVARSGMMREYIFRFHNPGKFKYMHPIMEEQLKETYGVMVYQEDVLKICHHFAGLDLADADVLRRAMSGKYRSKKELQRIVDKFFENCRKFGYPEEVTKEVWRQIESFAGYSFSKAHSASYAVESYQSLFLKARYPLEFMVGVINNFGGFYPSWVYFNEAKNWGAKIHPPCVNRGEFKTCIRGDDIYVGFVHINGLETAVGKAIENLRFTSYELRIKEDVRCTMYDVQCTNAVATDPAIQSSGGDYLDLADFVERVPASLEQVVILIRAGAFRFTGKPKAMLLWEAHMLLGSRKQGAGSRKQGAGSRKQGAGNRKPKTGSLVPVPDSRFPVPGYPPGRHHVNKEHSLVADHPGAYFSRSLHPATDIPMVADQSLFNTRPKKFELPALSQSTLEEVYDEIELLGWPVSNSYFELLETSFRGEIMARDMMGKLGKKVRMLGLLVTIKYVRTVRKEWMHFGTFIDFEGQFFDTVHFPQAVEKYPFRGEGVYLVMGKIVEEFGFPSLEVEKMAKMPLKKDPRS